jgi:hypothetical protein
LPEFGDQFGIGAHDGPSEGMDTRLSPAPRAGAFRIQSVVRDVSALWELAQLAQRTLRSRHDPARRPESRPVLFPRRCREAAPTVASDLSETRWPDEEAEEARTSARMPVRIDSGREGQASMISARPGSSGSARVAHGVARRGRTVAWHGGLWRLAELTLAGSC